jgi:hypothetical protein
LHPQAAWLSAVLYIKTLGIKLYPINPNGYWNRIEVNKLSIGKVIQ